MTARTEYGHRFLQTADDDFPSGVSPDARSRGADRDPCFPREVRYRSEIEPTFERHVYGPVIRTVLRVATGMRVLQAGASMPISATSSLWS